MLRYSPTLFAVLISITLCCTSRTVGTSAMLQDGRTDTCFYLIKVPPDLDVPGTPYFDTLIVRKEQCSVHALELPSWGTETSYVFFPADTAVKISGIHLSTHFFHGQHGIIDITSLPAGSYSVSLMACGNGGSFSVRIK